jgi:large conductance mechanosensitive channel
VAQLLEDFKKFLFQGNLVVLAVAFVIGGAFALVVKALVADLIMPIVAMVIGKPDFSALTFTINSSLFKYGDFLTVLIAFVSTAAAVFFFVVKPYELFEARKPKDPTTKDCPECTTEIPIGAKRCPQCTAVLAA